MDDLFQGAVFDILVPQTDAQDIPSLKEAQNRPVVYYDEQLLFYIRLRTKDPFPLEQSVLIKHLQTYIDIQIIGKLGVEEFQMTSFPSQNEILFSTSWSTATEPLIEHGLILFPLKLSLGQVIFI